MAGMPRLCCFTVSHITRQRTQHLCGGGRSYCCSQSGGIGPPKLHLLREYTCRILSPNQHRCIPRDHGRKHPHFQPRPPPLSCHVRRRCDRLPDSHRGGDTAPCLGTCSSGDPAWGVVGDLQLFSVECPRDTLRHLCPPMAQSLPGLFIYSFGPPG